MEQRTLEQGLEEVRQQHFELRSAGARVASSEPPLYYALELIPYGMAETILDRLCADAAAVGASMRAARARPHRRALARARVRRGDQPVVLYAIVNTVSNHAALGIVSHALSSSHVSLGEIGYIRQLYLPRLPGMGNDIPGLFTTRQLWFNGYVGLYGWFDTTFPAWVYNVALIPAGVIAASPRAPANLPRRYLLPLLPLLAAALALAAPGAGRRWGPAAGVCIVVLFFTHDLFSQLLVVSRFYG